MTSSNLQSVTDAIVRYAQQRGYILAREIREHLSQAGLSEDLWKDVAALARPTLRYRNGRYYYGQAVSERVRKEQDQQRTIQLTVRQLVREYRAPSRKVERREQDRVSFIHPIKVQAEDNSEFTLLSRDVSATGIRLIGTRRLLGQKLRIFIPRPSEATAQLAQTHTEGWWFQVRILWTCAVGEDLFENGGAFLEVASELTAQ